MPGTTGRFCLVHSYIFIEEVFKLLFSKEGIDHFKDPTFFFGFQHPDHFSLFLQRFIHYGNFLRCAAIEVYYLVNCYLEISGNLIENICQNFSLSNLEFGMIGEENDPFGLFDLVLLPRIIFGCFGSEFPNDPEINTNLTSPILCTISPSICAYPPRLFSQSL